MKSPKTTLTGLAATGGGITALITAINSGHANVETVTTSLAAIFTGIGLIFAKDEVPNTLTKQ